MHFTASLASLVGLVSCAATSAFLLRGTPPARYSVRTVQSDFCRTARVPIPRTEVPVGECVRGRCAQYMSATERDESDMSSVEGVRDFDTARPNPSKAREHVGYVLDGTGSDRGNLAPGTLILPQLSTASTAPARTEIPTEVAVVGNPQKVVEKEYSIEAILKELAEIQDQGPKNCCVLGTRHCSYLHQQIIELLAYALVLSGNHVFTSGALGTNAATIRGALRAERDDLLTVVLPQSRSKQSEASRELLEKVKNVITMPQNDNLPLDAASRLCNINLLTRTDQLICFAFHDSNTIIETSKEARKRNMIVTDLYLD